jgi:tetratricopeptide (TPR) repeat protein
MPALYDLCPCGSGQKFKWCCHAIEADVNEALQHEENGQHEVALRCADELARKHPNNPEAWGKKAFLYLLNNKQEQAEAALDAAFKINPEYPYGLLLQSRLRFAEGEIRGALLLSRRAAEAYHPDTFDALSDVYTQIAEFEFRLNNPVAVLASLERLRVWNPDSLEIQQNLNDLCGSQSNLPASARKSYALRPIPESVGTYLDPRFGRMVKNLTPLCEKNPTNPALWFNLGLVHAWLGENLAAVTALNRSIEVETDLDAAVESAALAEVLRLGGSMQDHSDYCGYSFAMRITNVQAIQELLNEWGRNGQLVNPRTNEQQTAYEWDLYETSGSGLVTVGRPVFDRVRPGGVIHIEGNSLLFLSPRKDFFDRTKEEVRSKLMLGLTDLRESHGPGSFNNILNDAFFFPVTAENQEQAREFILAQGAKYFEETWIHQPRKSLSGQSPINAVASLPGRFRVLGILQFLEECSETTPLKGCDFDRVRRRLNLPVQAAATADNSTTAALPQLAPAEILSMNVAGLFSLGPEDLSLEQLEAAYQASYRQDARDLAGRFAQTLVARPTKEGKTDRYAWFAFLVQKSLSENAFDSALTQVTEAVRQDAETNQGKRQTDFELLRAKVLARKGDIEQSKAVYQQLIDRSPRDFKVRGAAAKEMLDLKQGPAALFFAEQGAKAAKEAGDRDSAGYLEELAAAARKLQVGSRQL